MAIVDELVTILGVKLAADAMGNIAQFKGRIAEIPALVANLGKAATGAVMSISALVKQASDSANDLEKLSKSTGISTDSLQEWGYAAEATGGDAKAVQNDLAGLQQRFMVTGKAAEEMLGNMADHFSHLSGEQAKLQGKYYGFGDDTIQMLQKGREGLAALKDEAHKMGAIIPDEALKRGQEFNQQLGRLMFTVKNVTAQIALATLPVFSKVVETFKNFLMSNREWISLNIQGIFEGISNAVGEFSQFIKDVKEKLKDFLKPVTEQIDKFLPKMSKAELFTHLFRGVLMGLTVILAPLIAKFALIAAGAILLAFAFESLYVYITGGDSIIGRAIEWFKKFYKEFDWLVDVVGSVIGFIVGYIAAMKVAGMVTTAFSTGMKALNVILAMNPIGILIALLAVLAVLIYKNWNEFKIFGQIISSDISSAFKGAWEWVVATWGGISDWFSEKWQAVTDALPDFSEWATEGVDKIKSIWDGIKAYFENLWAEIMSHVPDIGGTIGKGVDKVKSFFGFGEEEKATPAPGKDILQGVAAAQEIRPVIKAQASKALPQMASAHGKPATEINDNKTITQNIYTSDPQQAADLMQRGLDSQSVFNINTPGQLAPTGAF